ncbi:MAG: two-component system sensor histidine kinase AlgZ [Arcticibacterium sp.]|jgi:two-component system sensor histidine kinase AlgZ
MTSIFRRNHWFLSKLLVLISISIPLGIMAYESIILGQDSVVFLADYPDAVGIVIVIYYALLLVAGIVWIIIRLKSLLVLRNEKIKSEMLHLQSQVNPHFFFNMLNNLYGMVGKDVEKSKALILKLSDLMRYSIYEGEKNEVSLEEEVAYLKNYIELNQMRYHKKIDVKFTVNMEADTFKVLPLLFIILLENAFKHGVENMREDAYIHISLNANKNAIDFEIENNFDGSQIPERKGIGLKNLKRRLALRYPKKHTLEITNSSSFFKAKLQLQK